MKSCALSHTICAELCSLAEFDLWELTSLWLYVQSYPLLLNLYAELSSRWIYVRSCSLPLNSFLYLFSGRIQTVVNEALTLIDTNRAGWSSDLEPFLR